MVTTKCEQHFLKSSSKTTKNYLLNLKQILYRKSVLLLLIVTLKYPLTIITTISFFVWKLANVIHVSSILFVQSKIDKKEILSGSGTKPFEDSYHHVFGLDSSRLNCQLHLGSDKFDDKN